jgi:hypothetical protein
MIKLISVLTFTLVLSAAALAFLGLPGTDAEAAHKAVAVNCPLQEVALDEGYGITRMEMRPVCGD